MYGVLDGNYLLLSTRPFLALSGSSTVLLASMSMLKLTPHLLATYFVVPWLVIRYLTCQLLSSFVFWRCVIVWMVSPPPHQQLICTPPTLQPSPRLPMFSTLMLLRTPTKLRLTLVSHIHSMAFVLLWGMWAMSPLPSSPMILPCMPIWYVLIKRKHTLIMIPRIPISN